MKKLCNILLASVFTLSVASVASVASASSFPTDVQFSTSANGTYDITGISSFDWDNHGSAVIEDALVSASNGATSLNQFFTNPFNVGDTITFRLHAQDRLTDFRNTTGTLPNNGLATSGSGSGSYEVTATFDAIETAKVLDNSGTPVIQFTSITGTFEYYLDSNPNSDVDTGVGYNDGTAPNNPFLSGTMDSINGLFTGGLVGHGSNLLQNTITYYDPNVIEVDPANPANKLVGATFSSTLDYSNQGSFNAVDIGGVVGASPYTVKSKDLILAADANNGFSAVPEPTTMLLFGTGLIGLAGLKRKRS
jgi:hypothetical protein